MARKEKPRAGTQTTPPGPVVLAINICDMVIRDELTKKVSLIGLFSLIGSSNFPCTHPLMHVYLALTEGHGKHDMEVRLIRVEDEKLIAGVVGSVEFADPLQVAELNLIWQNILFEKPGEYSVQIFCKGDSVPIGFRKFHVVRQGAMPLTSGSEVK